MKIRFFSSYDGKLFNFRPIHPMDQVSLCLPGFALEAHMIKLVNLRNQARYVLACNKNVTKIILYQKIYCSVNRFWLRFVMPFEFKLLAQGLNLSTFCSLYLLIIYNMKAMGFLLLI